MACTLVAICVPAAAQAARGERLRDLSDVEMDHRARADAQLLRSYARASAKLIDQLDKHAALWDRDKQEPLTPDERRLAISLFEQVLAYVVALDSMSGFHFDFWRIDVVKRPARHARHFALAFAAYCMKVRLGLAFVDRTLNKPQFEKLLDEGSPEHGLPAGAYGQL
jgi:hypothetical protein